MVAPSHLHRARMLSLRAKLAWPVVSPLRPLADLTTFQQIDKAMGMYQQKPIFHQPKSSECHQVLSKSRVSLPLVYDQPAWCVQECIWGNP